MTKNVPEDLQTHYDWLTHPDTVLDGGAFSANNLMSTGEIAREIKYIERIGAAEQERDAAKAGKDNAYAERDRLVCALSKLFPSHLERHPESDTTWEDDWRWIIFINIPSGQCSWHIHESEIGWFSHLERQSGNSWDGHTTEEKYKRLTGATINGIVSQARRDALEEAMNEIEDEEDPQLQEVILAVRESIGALAEK